MFTYLSIAALLFICVLLATELEKQELRVKHLREELEQTEQERQENRKLDLDLLYKELEELEELRKNN